MDPSSALIVFREVLEAALVVGIVSGRQQGRRRPRRVGGRRHSGRRARRLRGGGRRRRDPESRGRRRAGAAQRRPSCSPPSAMLGWHCVWMGRHGRDIARHMSQVSRAVVQGSRPLYALGVVVGLAVAREGSEAVLFLYGIAAGSVPRPWTMLRGGLLGLAGGAAVGAAIYSGLMRHSRALSVRRDDLDDHPAGGRHGLAGRRLPGARPICCRRSGADCGTPREYCRIARSSAKCCIRSWATTPSRREFNCFFIPRRC